MEKTDHLEPKWQRLAELASRETDGDKLLRIVEELVQALDPLIDSGHRRAGT